VVCHLKAHIYGVAAAGKQAEEYANTTKMIGEYVGRTYGHDMKNLDLQLNAISHWAECKWACVGNLL